MGSPHPPPLRKFTRGFQKFFSLALVTLLEYCEVMLRKTVEEEEEACGIENVV